MSTQTNDSRIIGIQVTCEKGETDANLGDRTLSDNKSNMHTKEKYRSERSSLMLFSCKHENRQDKGRRDKHFYKDSLCDTGTILKKSTEAKMSKKKNS